MRINHNIQALNAYRQLSQNQGVVSKHLERLSSGLRINRSADDAAGLAISEKMRSQIRGLAMAERNTMDGISLIQTAEGALGTTHEILQRMRELSVQAANGTLEDDDRKAIQDEIDQLTQEIDRIAKTTQFNGKKLLRGSASGRAFASSDALQYTSNNNGTWNAMVTANPTDKASVDINLGFDLGKLDAATADGTTFFINGKTYELDITGSGKEGIVGNGNIAVNITGWVDGGADSDVVNNINEVLNQLKDAIMANDKSFDSAASQITPASDAAVDGALDQNGVLTLTTANNLTPGQASAMIVSANAPSGGVEFYKPGTTDSATSLVAKEEATGANSISISFTEAPKAGDYIKIDNLMINFGSPEVPFDPLTNTVTIDVANKSGADVLQEIDNLLKDISNIPAQKSSAIPALSSHNIVGNNLILNTTKSDDGKVFGDATSNGLEVEIHDADFVSTSGADLKLDMQVGANANESMEISLSVMDAAALRLAFAADRKTPITTPGADAIAGIDVSSSQDAAKAAIAVIDNAVKMVSEERSKMGAYQNRMEHTITNLSTANENLTAAESRIRDADMAMEMTNFTKNNIINQAATAMLAQANQLPQGILQLLK